MRLGELSCRICRSQVASCLVAFGVGQPLLAARVDGLTLADPGVPRPVAGGAGHLVLIGAIAVGVGAMLRRTAGAVAVLFVVLPVGSGLVALPPSPWHNDITKYRPARPGWRCRRTSGSRTCSRPSVGAPSWPVTPWPPWPWQC